MKRIRNFLAFAVAALAGLAANASTGLVELPADAGSGPVTVFYPATQPERSEQRGPFRLDVAPDAPALPGRRRLVVISHGSTASPWVHAELARALVAAGFTVALPEHQGDNHQDAGEPGPPSWKRRPLEVTRAIDRLAREPRFAPGLDLDRVGMYGMSAGGHTALTLAGGRWSPSRLRKHCQDHLAEDFHACAGPAVSLDGGPFDGIKRAMVRAVLDRKLDDSSWYGHEDARIAAIVAGVPFAADFDPESLKAPKAALAIVSARADRWLVPSFHSDFVLRHCTSCEHLAELPAGGHGALLGPLPPRLSGAVAALIADPPGFRRDTEVPKLNAAIAAFFVRHLPEKGR
ncbi:alpha/beta hydrolase family protein [Caldimonas tepidiphila]|uniref:alpha/beta hydrolase family protein n=1 Tax=Caldimonas tepidiphila TaxID=2315841 RepID=UPI000E5A411F|nr:dienelactone hydrolase [Caldimonas tepidiphila]